MGPAGVRRPRKGQRTKAFLTWNLLTIVTDVLQLKAKMGKELIVFEIMCKEIIVILLNLVIYLI